jgi:hypothetical protein
MGVTVVFVGLDSNHRVLLSVLDIGADCVLIDMDDGLHPASFVVLAEPAVK